MIPSDICPAATAPKFDHDSKKVSTARLLSKYMAAVQSQVERTQLTRAREEETQLSITFLPKHAPMFVLHKVSQTGGAVPPCHLSDHVVESSSSLRDGAQRKNLVCRKFVLLQLLLNCLSLRVTAGTG